MKNNYKRSFWFTLIELLVSITIIWIIIVSVITVFISSIDISMKSDINRSMQENIKNVIETISEDIRKNWTNGIWISNIIPDTNCTSWSWIISPFYSSWSKLCISWNEYYLADKDINDWWIRVLNNSCDELTEHCIITKNGIPLSNSFVSIKSLEFRYSDEIIPKVTILLTMQPSIKKGVKANLVKENIINLQTTISVRPF